jgi:putative flippase GtrA
MIERARALVAWSRTRQGKKLTRYLVGSVVTTGVSFVWITAMYGFKIIPGVIWATLSGNLVAVIPSYYWNRAWAWGKRGKSHFRKEIVPYWSMAFLGIAFSQLGAFWARHEVHTHSWSHLANTALVAGTNVVCFAIFWVLKLIVFNRIFHVASPVEDDDDDEVDSDTPSVITSTLPLQSND